MTKAERDAAVLAAFARLSLAMSASDAHAKQKSAIDEELRSAEAELRAIARRSRE